MNYLPRPISNSSLALFLVDILLFMKLLAFVPSNYWLLRFGPRLAQRITALVAIRDNHGIDARALDLYVRTIENSGASFRIIDGREHDAIKPLRFVRPSRKDTFKERAPWIYYSSNIVSATPVVTISATAIAFIVVRHASLFTVVTTVALVSAIAAATLATAPLTRMTLGAYDVHTAGLQPYMRAFRRWRISSGPSDNRDGLVVYFLTLFVLSTYLYAFCYYLLFVLQDRFDQFHAFTFNVDSPHANFVTWIYFSVVSVATVGYGDISPLNHWAQLVVITQVLTGPFLLSWLLAIALSERS